MACRQRCRQPLEEEKDFKEENRCRQKITQQMLRNKLVIYNVVRIIYYNHALNETLVFDGGCNGWM
jgi:hypothetical protein